MAIKVIRDSACMRPQGPSCYSEDADTLYDIGKASCNHRRQSQIKVIIRNEMLESLISPFQGQGVLPACPTRLTMDILY